MYCQLTYKDPQYKLSCCAAELLAADVSMLFAIKVVV